MTSDNIDQAVEQVLSRLASADEDEIVRQLDAELEQQTESQAMVLGGEPAPWVLGEGSGFGSAAQRFLSFYGDALHREICDPEQGRLKNQYRNVIGSSGTNSVVKAIAPAVLAAIGVGASLVNPATIAAIVALWLVRLGLDQWCALPRSRTSTSTEGDGGAPAAMDPDLAPDAGAAAT